MIRRTVRTEITIGGVIAMFAAILTIYGELGPLISRIVSQGPSWLRHSNTPWIAAIFLIYGGWTLLVLRRAKRQGSAVAVAAGRTQTVLASIAKFSKENHITFGSIEALSGPFTNEQGESLLQFCKNELPDAIEKACGRIERTRYLNEIASLDLLLGLRKQRDADGVAVSCISNINWWLGEYLKREALEAVKRDAL